MIDIKKLNPWNIIHLKTLDELWYEVDCWIKHYFWRWHVVDKVDWDAIICDNIAFYVYDIDAIDTTKTYSVKDNVEWVILDWDFKENEFRTELDLESVRDRLYKKPTNEWVSCCSKAVVQWPMNQEEYLKRFKEITNQMYSITEAKNKDYSWEWSNNAFKNFEAVETFWIKTEDWFITRMTDKLMRISHLTRQTNAVADEKITDTLLDLANYSILFKIWLENKWK